jgi:hypothetical protein
LPAVLVLLACLPGCAWQNPENRRLWNAFETHWVPTEEPAATLALPLTLPGGLLAILLDVAIVHPFNVVDDAFKEATKDWDQIDWEGEYWYQSGMTPIRCAHSGFVFALGVVLRVIFDVPAFDSDLQAVPQSDSPESQAGSYDEQRDWLQGLLRGELRRSPLSRRSALADLPWKGELAELAARVLREASHRARIAYYTWASKARPPGHEDPWLGLTDSDARVRAWMLTTVIRQSGIDMPAELAEALLADPDPVVAELAWQLIGARR